MIENELAYLRDQPGELCESQGVDALRADMIAHAYYQHLVEAALDGPSETRMAFHSVHRDYQIRSFEGCLVEIDGQTSVNLAEFHDIHRRVDGNTHRLFRYAISRQVFPLACCGGPAVASHGWHYEHFHAATFEFVDQGPHNSVDSADAAASYGEGHSVPPHQQGFDCRLRKFGPNMFFDVLHARGIEYLFHGANLRQLSAGFSAPFKHDASPFARHSSPAVDLFWYYLPRNCASLLHKKASTPSFLSSLAQVSA